MVTATQCEHCAELEQSLKDAKRRGGMAWSLVFDLAAKLNAIVDFYNEWDRLLDEELANDFDPKTAPRGASDAMDDTWEAIRQGGKVLDRLPSEMREKLRKPR